MSTLSAYKTAEREGYRRNLRAGLWMDGSFDWYREEDNDSENQGEIRSFSQSYSKKEISFIKFTINNRSNAIITPKIVCHYENAQERQAVAFYSPHEQAILHVGQKSIALLGGVVRGRGISQYCIQGKGSLYQHGCFKSLKEGLLLYSPLARGEVTSIFSLETEIMPQECIEAIAWVIHSATKEEAKILHTELLSQADSLAI